MIDGMNILKGMANLFFSSKEKKTILPKKIELMIITMEECGELIQACSKYIRFNNKDRIKQEAGDLYAMLELMVEYKLLDWKDIKQQAKNKRKKLSQYSSLI